MIDEEYKPEYVLFLLPCFLGFSIPIRIFTKKCNSPFPQNFFLFTISVILGLVVTYIPALYKVYAGLRYIPAQHILTVFVPSFVVSTIYRMDFYIFVRCLTQVIIISFVCVVLNTLVLGSILKEILHRTWPETMGWLAALTTIPIQPSNIIGMFKELAKYKYLGTMLEAESLFSYVMVQLIFELLLGLHDQVFNAWYQYFIFFIRYILLSMLIGIIFGKCGTVIMCWLYNEPLGALCTSISITYFAYCFAEYLLHTSGVLCIICTTCFLATEKHRFSSEVDNCIYGFWGTLNYMFEIMVLMIVTVEMTRLVANYVQLRDTYATVITYFSANILRVMSFSLVGPLIHRMTYNINMKCLVVLGWSGVKGSINFLLCLILLTNASTTKYAQTFLIEIMVYAFLSLVINSTTMKITLQLIGLSELSATRKANMNICMKFLMEKRICIINILKLNRYLSDANWYLVRLETMMKHPYKLKSNEPSYDEEEMDFMWNTSSAICPDCLKEVPFDISEKEFSEMMKEAQIKVLKAKKVSIIRQYENGIINKNVLQVLVHTFEIMIESNNKNNTVELKIYKRNFILTTLYKILKFINRDMIPDIPEHHFHRFCYFLMLHFLYDYIFGVFVLAYTTFVIASPRNIYSFTFHAVFWGVFLFDMFLKLCAFTTEKKISFWEYIKRVWNVIDFLLLWLDLGIIVILMRDDAPYFIEYVIALRYLRVFYHCKILLPYIISAIEYRVDAKICFAYDVATALVNCCDEILEIMQQVIDVKAIRDIFQTQIEEERFALIKEMEHVQRTRPWIAITVKTKQAIRTTLNAMEAALNELKISGFVDNIEYAFIFKEIFEKQKFLRNMKFVQPSPPKVIFNEVPWMANDEEVIDYLYNHVQAVSWDAGEVVCKDGRTSKGVYIVVTGLLRLRYSPHEAFLEKMHHLGLIPIVDYLSTVNYKSKVDDNIMSGNSIGELSVLTGRPYDCTIVADSPSQAYLLTTEVIKAAMDLNSDPVKGLEARMWKCTTINLAVAILMDIPLYQSFTQEQIKFKLERAFMPNLRCYKMFVVTEMMDDIILVEGVVSDYNTGEIFIAPTLIPRNIQKLILPTSSDLHIEEIVEPKLMIIPIGEDKAYEIMENEEEIAELISLPSSKCLLHAVRARERYAAKARKPSIMARKKSAVPSTGAHKLYSVSSEFDAEQFTTTSTKLIECLDSYIGVPPPSTRKLTVVSTADSEGRASAFYLTRNKILEENESFSNKKYSVAYSSSKS